MEYQNPNGKDYQEPAHSVQIFVQEYNFSVVFLVEWKRAPKRETCGSIWIYPNDIYNINMRSISQFFLLLTTTPSSEL